MIKRKCDKCGSEGLKETFNTAFCTNCFHEISTTPQLVYNSIYAELNKSGLIKKMSRFILWLSKKLNRQP